MGIYMYGVPEFRTKMKGVDECRDFSLLPLFDLAITSFVNEACRNEIENVSCFAPYMPRSALFELDSREIKWMFLRCPLYFGALMDIDESRFAYRIESCGEEEQCLKLFSTFEISFGKKDISSFFKEAGNGKLSRIPPMMIPSEMRELYS